MASYYVESKLSPEAAIGKAVAFFGSRLEQTEHNACCVRFEGGGGHVLVSVSSGDKTRVDLETREWDYDVKQFMRRL